MVLILSQFSNDTAALHCNFFGTVFECMQIEGPRKGTPSLRVECTPSFAPKHCAKIPCSDRDHEHPPWPEGVEQVLVIEACETKCGWCKYHTNFANNLRIVSNRFLECMLSCLPVFSMLGDILQTRTRFHFRKLSL